MSDIYHAGGGNTWPVKMQEVKAPEDGRCPLTGNPCGIDTWPDPIVNPACPCQEKVVSKESLDAVIERLEQTQDNLAIHLPHVAKDLSRLIKAYRALREALEFYADIKKWGGCPGGNSKIKTRITSSDYQTKMGAFDDMTYGGKHARAILTTHSRSGESDADK